jgi:hypothetical protein
MATYSEKRSRIDCAFPDFSQLGVNAAKKFYG